MKCWLGLWSWLKNASHCITRPRIKTNKNLRISADLEWPTASSRFKSCQQNVAWRSHSRPWYGQYGFHIKLEMFLDAEKEKKQWSHHLDTSESGNKSSYWTYLRNSMLGFFRFGYYQMYNLEKWSHMATSKQHSPRCWTCSSAIIYFRKSWWGLTQTLSDEVWVLPKAEGQPVRFIHTELGKLLFEDLALYTGVMSCWNKTLKSPNSSWNYLLCKEWCLLGSNWSLLVALILCTETVSEYKPYISILLSLHICRLPL